MPPALRPSPLTQLIDEGLVSRDELRLLMHRTDRHALFRLVIWALVLCCTGLMIHYALQLEGSLATASLLMAMLVHGFVLVHHFSLQHECVHFTAFRTRVLNDIVGYICGLVILLPHRFFRYEHCDHHTYTQQTGKDPEMIPMPSSLREYLLYLSSWQYWKAKFSELFLHAAGKISASEKKFIPATDRRSIILEARLMLTFYLLVLIVCLVADWWAPLWYWWIPLFLGEPLMRAIRMTEHVGRPTNDNMRDNTRSNQVSLPLRFLCWNMNYHAEHHYASSVPFHALPRLHNKLTGQLHVERDGYVGAHREILKQLRGRQPDDIAK